MTHLPRERIATALRRVAFLLLLAQTQASAQMTDVLTYHNETSRTGQALHEEVLSAANVNVNHFGKLRILAADGKVDAQPLYAAGVNIPSKGVRNVVYVATEHDSVYAYDADTGALYWQVSMLSGTETTSDARSCNQVVPEIGVTATPVIDRQLGPNGTIFVAAMSKLGASTYIQRLHALDIATGADRLPPVVVTGSYPGTGDGSNGAGYVIFNPAQYKERSGLLICSGTVYTTWSSHCDVRPYLGWIMGYDEGTLAQKSVFCITPNGNEGAVWMSGAGMCADATGNLYMLVGNGTFDTTLDAHGMPINHNFGNTFLKLSVTGTTIAPADYFGTYNILNENANDTDLGSGGALLLPDMITSSGSTVHLAVGAGKDTNLFVVNRDNMGKFSASNDNAIYQKLAGALPGGVWGMPAYFDGNLYYGPVGQTIRAYKFTNALLGSSPSSATAITFPYPGATPSISASGTSNGILWAAYNANPAVMYAYDARNLGTLLYATTQASGSRDSFGTGNKFITPTIASGRVYVGTTTGVAVFGLLDQATLTPIQKWRDNNFGNPSNVGAGADTYSAAGDGVANLIKYALGLNPKTAIAPAQLPQPSTTAAGGHSYLTLTVNRPAAAAGVTYIVEVSSDLKSWFSGTSDTTTLISNALQLVVRDNTSLDASPRRYIRLRVTRP